MFEEFAREGGADEHFLARAVAEADGFPAVLRGDGDADFNGSLCVAHGADDAGDDGPDVVTSDEALKHGPEIVEDAVFDLELALSRAEAK